MEKGRKDGLPEGRQIERRELAKKMLNKGSSIADVKEITGLPEAEVEAIKKQLN